MKKVIIFFTLLFLLNNIEIQAQGCITITQPQALTTSIVGTNVLCNGASTGAANLTVNGGTSPYTYSWSNGAVTEDLTAIVANTYMVTVVDANTCSSIASVAITQPTVLGFTATQQNVKCFGAADASITILGSGGVSPYTYSLDDALTFPNTTGIFSGLSAGTYKPSIKDNNGCITKCQ